MFIFLNSILKILPSKIREILKHNCITSPLLTPTHTPPRVTREENELNSIWSLYSDSASCKISSQRCKEFELKTKASVSGFIFWASASFSFYLWGRDKFWDTFLLLVHKTLAPDFDKRGEKSRISTKSSVIYVHE